MTLKLTGKRLKYLLILIVLTIGGFVLFRTGKKCEANCPAPDEKIWIGLSQYYEGRR